MKTSDFYYNLPSQFIAQTPIEPRDRSRLMVIDRCTGSIEHRTFLDIVNYLESGDALVFNDSRVIPARLCGQKGETNIEVLLLRRIDNGIWETLVRPGKKVKIGTMITITAESAEIDDNLTIEIIHIYNNYQ